MDATASHSQHATRGSRRWASLRKRVGLQDSLDRSRHDEAPNRSDAGVDSRRRSSNAVDFLPEICRLESYLRAVLSAHWNQLPSRAGLKPEIVDYFGRWKNRKVARMQVRFYKLAIEESVEASSRLWIVWHAALRRLLRILLQIQVLVHMGNGFIPTSSRRQEGKLVFPTNQHQHAQKRPPAFKESK